MDLMSLAARLTLDMRDYEEAMKKAEKSAQSFSDRFGGSISKIGGIVKNVAKAGAVAIGAGSTVVGILTKQSVSAYSQYEQLSGGVKKLFGDAASKVEKYANQAYKTAGMSANQYMEQATSFSASLINSLGGDTKKLQNWLTWQCGPCPITSTHLVRICPAYSMLSRALQSRITPCSTT